MKVTTVLFRIFLLVLIVPLSFNLAKANPLTDSITIYTNVACNGGNTGQATASVAGGNTPYTYEWSTIPMQTTATATGLSAGMYIIEVIDASFNTATASVTLTQPPALNATIAVELRISCNGGNNGMLLALLSGGVTPYTYLWLPGGSTDDTASGLSAGTYSMQVTANNGCTASASYNFYQPNPLQNQLYSSGYIMCNGSTGNLYDSAMGGTAPYTYSWSNGSTDTSATGLLAGTYSVLLTDVNGCTTTASYTLAQAAALTLVYSSVNNTNCVNPNGSATTAVSGGTVPYTYMWSPLSWNGPTLSGIPPGTYSCAVTDHYGCTASISGTVAGTSAPLLIVSSTPDSNRLCVGTLTASVSGGLPPYTYLWEPGGATTAAISNLCAGFYSCQVTDNAECTDTSLTALDTCCIVYCLNNYVQPICIITIDTMTNKCDIVWERSNSPWAGGYGSFNLYRDTGLGNYAMVHSQALNVLSEYIDPGSDPSAGPVSYKLSTTDSCGESGLSAHHTSIYLTTIAGINVYILNWTAYVGFTPTEYIIYRGPSLGWLTPLDTVANNVYTFHDTLPPLGSYYAVEAVNPNGACYPSNHSASKSSFSLFSGAFSNGFNTGALGVGSMVNNISGLKLYPNPNNGMFTLSYSISGSDNVTVSIINELGQQVYTEQKYANNGSVTEQLNMESLAPGIYILRIQTSQGITVQKLAIMQ